MNIEKIPVIGPIFKMSRTMDADSKETVVLLQNGGGEKLRRVMETRKEAVAAG